MNVCICRPANALQAAKTFGAQESWRKIQLSNKKQQHIHGIFGPFVSPIRIFVGPLGITCFCQTHLGESPLGVGPYLGSPSVIRPARRRVMARRNHWGGCVVGWFHAGCICFHGNLRGQLTLKNPEIRPWKGFFCWWQLKYFLFSPRNLGKMNPFWLIFFKGVGSTTNKGWTR